MSNPVLYLDRRVVNISSTSAIWQAAHSALSAGRWSTARAYLDDLGLRNDNVDMLLSVEQYVALSGRPLHSDYVAVLADRIDLVNSKVGR